MSNWWGASLLRAPVGYILALQSYQTYTNISNPCTNLFASTLFMISPLKGASSVLFFFYLNRKHLKVHLLSASREGQSQWQYTWHFFISHFKFLLPCPNNNRVGCDIIFIPQLFLSTCSTSLPCGQGLYVYGNCLPLKQFTGINMNHMASSDK